MAGQQPSIMEEVSAPRGPVHVKDVPCDLFISAFAAYLKQTNKVGVQQGPGRASRPMMGSMLAGAAQTADRRAGRRRQLRMRKAGRRPDLRPPP